MDDFFEKFNNVSDIVQCITVNKDNLRHNGCDFDSEIFKILWRLNFCNELIMALKNIDIFHM